MKELIIQELNKAKIELDKIVPLTKKKVKSVSIIDVSPLELLQFMKDNDIPDSAYFDGKDNGDNGWSDILLSWQVDVPTTDEDKLKFKRRRFTDIAWKLVYNTLTNSKDGYKRVGYNSGELKRFDNTTVYDMYMTGDFDRLVEYYSLPFIKI